MKTRSKREIKMKILAISQDWNFLEIQCHSSFLIHHIITNAKIIVKEKRSGFIQTLRATGL